MDWIGSFLPPDRKLRIDQLTTVPLESVTLTGQIFNELQKIFESPNSHFSYEFRTPELADDWSRYRNDKLKDLIFFRTLGWDAYRYAINSVLVVDLPQVQDSVLPEPYLSLVSISSVVEASPNLDGSLGYLIFEQNNKYYAYDDTYYRVFDKDLVIISENAHNLGFCPARMFWKDLADGGNLFDHENQVTRVLGDLDWYLFWCSTKKYNDLSGAFPITITYEEECDYHDDSGECMGGYINGDQTAPCPRCSEKKILGAGSILTVPAPIDKDDADLGKNPVSRIGINADSLKYVKEEKGKLADTIVNQAIGIDYFDNTNVAKNEAQISSMYESRTNVLLSVKSCFEAIHGWANDTIARLRYGNGFVRSSIGYGTEFYLATIQQLYDRYSKGKNDGIPSSELDAIYEQIIDTRYRNNENKKVRVRMLMNLDPFPHLDIKDVLEVSRVTPDAVNKVDLQIKLMFNTFVKRFERENGSIENFGSDLPLYERIDIIKQKFKEYAA